MKPFALYITYISWGNSGKLRPVLVFSLENETAFVYTITSRYENKSEEIQSQYFKIVNWSQAGLKKQSYIDTGRYFPISVFALKHKKPIGSLSQSDKKALFAFLLNKRTHKI
jgi:hypothetical protein